jgi:hypothetical protein
MRRGRRIARQEKSQGNFLLENSAAVKINIATLTHKLTPLLQDLPRLARLKKNANRTGKPEATFDIARRKLA